MPKNGFAETYIPWNTQVSPQVLDYILVSADWHAATELQLCGEPEWTATTSHIAQHLSISPVAAPAEGDPRHPQGISKTSSSQAYMARLAGIHRRPNVGINFGRGSREHARL